jgi:sulfane dehydrogenase subunit SoxC
VFAEAKAGRRDFIRRAFAAAVAGARPCAGRAGPGQPGAAEGGDPNILNLPAHSTGLGQPWPPTATASRRSTRPTCSAGRARADADGAVQSVSFAPLQSLFGIVTPSGLHFERHHQGWWDVDPSQAPADDQRLGRQAAQDTQGLHAWTR